MKKMTKILDCTLRDGGYYNNWFFDQSLVKNYLSAMQETKIDFVELGFRFLSDSQDLGSYAYSNETLLEDLDLPDGPEYGVMINGAEYLKKGKSVQNIRDNFLPRRDSKISLVRIAINFNNAHESKDLAVELKSLGYKVGLNLMQSGFKTEEEYILLINLIKEWLVVDILYFADSLGNMNPEEVKRISNIFKSCWSGLLGIHTHNNKGLALINSLTAIENGIDYCDATLTGMGRGAGNVETENLILETFPDRKFSSLQKSLDDFSSLKKKYNWGTNFYYHYAALHNIHPTYVQTMISDDRYSMDQTSSVLTYLSKKESSSFSEDSITEANYKNKTIIKGKWDASDFLSDKEVLLIGAGETVKTELKDILEFVKERKPFVISLNKNNLIEKDILDLVILSNVSRTMVDLNLLENLTCPLVLPESQIGALLDHPADLNVLDYALNIEKNEFKIFPNYCILQTSLAFNYALAFLMQARAKTIYLAGFDGYQKDNPKQQEMEGVIDSYNALNNRIPLVPITPSKYKF